MTHRHHAVCRLRTLIRAAVLCIGAVALTGCAAFGQCGLRECSPDAQISSEVRTLLTQSPALEAPNLVSVRTVHSVVYLSGLVSTPYQIAEAGNIAESVPGVTDVRNLLSIDNSR